MLKKIFKVFLLIIASIILLIYVSGYSYLFRAARLTYMKGENSSTIDDGKYFPSKIISKGQPKRWPTDDFYNKIKLTNSLKKHLEETETTAFLVVKNGKIFQEHYWYGYGKYKASNSFSLAKTITVLLLGKAINDGRILNADQNFSDFYPEFSPNDFGKNLTLRNLASMESGLDWKEDYKNPLGPNAALYYGFSLADVVFNKKLITMPGEKFEYQSGATQLLGFAIGRAVGMPLSLYASSMLWKPLGMENDADWSTDDMGIEKTFCCIHSNARDFAKIGYLLLNKGKIDSVPLISESFINEMTTPTEKSDGAYGMGLWINNDYIIPHYYMRGLNGQYVVVIPQYDMIIIRLGKKEGEEKDSKNRPKETELYIAEVLKMMTKN